MKGFTLIEVVIVIILLSIIFCVAAPQYINYKQTKTTQQVVEIVDDGRPTITRSE